MVTICTSQIRSQINENVRTPCYIDIYLINVVGWDVILSHQYYSCLMMNNTLDAKPFHNTINKDRYSHSL